MTELHLQEYFSNDFTTMADFENKVMSYIFADHYEKDLKHISLVEKGDYKPKTNDCIKDILQCGSISSLDATDYGYLYEVILADKTNIARSRVSIMQAVKSILETYAHALVVFHYENTKDAEWRFTYMHKGSSQKDSTQVKRYTYLCGKGHPSHTVTKNFITLKNSNFSDESYLKAFNEGELSKEFYEKLFAWYEWAMPLCTFPQDSEKQENEENKLIRLITRLMFVWFIKQKELVPSKLFEPEFLATVLKNFDETSKTDGNFYNAILQNLFFATLNREIVDEERAPRAFATAEGTRDDKNLYRYEEMFSISKKDVVKLFDSIPFLNGGLFECFDRDKSTHHEMIHYDGFSRNAEKDKGVYKHRAFIPNCVFFDKEKGIISLLNEYNFTVEESSPMDVQVSLDPELLGNVFENLLGAWNPETKETVRSNTGSFYTPREIVQYMVDQSLVSYLNEKGIKESSLVEQYFLNEDEKIFDGISKEKKNEIIQTLLKVKILDPACGSGAFPVGCLTRMVNLICALNPATDTYDLKTKIIANNLYGIDIQTFAVQITKLRFFISLICEQEKTDDKKNNYGIKPLPNLETKFIAANTLVGLYKEKEMSFDSACQKKFDELLTLRQKHFSTSKRSQKKKLIVEYEKASDELIDLLKKEFKIPTSTEIAELQANVDRLQNDYDNCKDEKIVTKDLWGNESSESYKTETTKGILSDLKKAKNALSAATDPKKQSAALKDINAIAHWTPFDLNASSPFFDPFWMFGIKNKDDNFDIVIGNPPYIEEGKFKKAFDGFREQSDGIYYMGKMNIWYAFACFGVDWLKDNGTLSFIAKNNWGTSYGGKLLRNKITNDTQILKLIDFGSYMVFESADIQTMIMMFKKNNVIDNYTFDCRRLNKADALKSEAIAFMKDKSEKEAIYIEPKFTRSKFENKLFTFTVGKKEELLEKIASNSEYLTNNDATNGIHPHYDFVNNKINKAHPFTTIGSGIFGLSSQELNSLKLDKNEKKLIKPYYTTDQVHRYYTDKKNTLWIIYTTSDFKNPKSMDSYPHLKKHLDFYKDVISSDNKPYGLHRSREEHFFKNEKIIALRKCVGHPSFSYSDFDCYVSATFYVIQTERFNLKYLTGLLNSKLIEFWLHNRGKMQGDNFQLDKEPLVQIPIKKGTAAQQNKIISHVDSIISAKSVDSSADTTEEEKAIDKIVYEIYGITDQSEIEMIEGK